MDIESNSIPKASLREIIAKAIQGDQVPCLLADVGDSTISLLESKNIYLLFLHYEL